MSIRQGGRIGGKIAAAKMTPRERVARAKKASAAAARARTRAAKARGKAGAAWRLQCSGFLNPAAPDQFLSKMSG
jgi:hypothetical protein